MAGITDLWPVPPSAHQGLCGPRDISEGLFQKCYSKMCCPWRDKCWHGLGKWFGLRNSALYILCTLLLKAGGTGIVIESLLFKKWHFSWNKAMKFDAFSEITNLKIEVTGELHLLWFLCRVCAVIWTTTCQMMVFTAEPLLSLLIFIGEAQMYKLKKNCGNIFSKYGLCRVWEMLVLSLM